MSIFINKKQKTTKTTTTTTLIWIFCICRPGTIHTSLYDTDLGTEVKVQLFISSFDDNFK